MVIDLSHMLVYELSGSNEAHTRHMLVYELSGSNEAHTRHDQTYSISFTLTLLLLEYHYLLIPVTK